MCTSARKITVSAQYFESCVDSLWVIYRTQYIL